MTDRCDRYERTDVCQNSGHREVEELVRGDVMGEIDTSKVARLVELQAGTELGGIADGLGISESMGDMRPCVTAHQDHRCGTGLLKDCSGRSRGQRCWCAALC